MSSLLTLSVENFVLIKKAQIDFAAGLNVISGQTGAGKSLLLRALLFILGERFSAPDILNQARNKAQVDAHFLIEEDGLRRDLRALVLGDDWDGEELLISRSMDKSGRSRVRINGRLATLTHLKKIAQRLVSVLSQHEYQNLIKADLQNRLIDHFGGHLDVWNRFSRCRTKATQILSEIQELKDFEDQQESYLRRCREDFQTLDALDPKPEEYQEFGEELETLRRAQELRSTLLSVLDTLSENDPSLLSSLNSAERKIDNVIDVIPSLGAALDALESAREEINEAVYQVSRSEQNINDDPSRLGIVEDRLGAYKEASRRLRVPAEQLADEYVRLANLVTDDVADKILRLERSLKPVMIELKALDSDLSKRRKLASQTLQLAMVHNLRDLGMEKARFEVQLIPWSAKSADQLIPPAGGSAQVQFQLAANPGEAMRPIANVASGGELSRVMLALQRHLGKALEVALLVFDEVDQNVGGRLGPIIGRELSALGQERQVLVISHLPQVAAFADKHVLAEKHCLHNSTETKFKELNDQDRLQELAAMTRGKHITLTALNEAKELLELARRTIAEQILQAQKKGPDQLLIRTLETPSPMSA
jgi:DNA repair protein RecN (Recombination protein N)